MEEMKIQFQTDPNKPRKKTDGTHKKIEIFEKCSIN